MRLLCSDTAVGGQIEYSTDASGETRSMGDGLRFRLHPARPQLGIGTVLGHEERGRRVLLSEWSGWR